MATSVNWLFAGSCSKICRITLRPAGSAPAAPLDTFPLMEPIIVPGVPDGDAFWVASGVCDGPAGLKIYNADDPMNLHKIAWFSDINAFDVIPYQGVLMTIGSGGLYQYSYNGSDQVSLLSEIPIASSRK